MRRMVTLILQPMNLLGLNPLKKATFLGCYIRALWICITLTYAFCGIILYMYHSTNNDVLHNMIAAMPFASITSMIITVYIFGHLCKSSIGDVLRSVDSHVFQYPDEEDFHVEYDEYLSEEKLTKVQLLLLMWGLSAYFGTSLSPLTTYILTGIVKLHIYPEWFPWSPNSIFGRILSGSLQMLSANSCSLVLYSTQLYFVMVMVEFLRQHQKLQYAIETLSERSHKRVLLSKTGRFMETPIEFSREEYDIAFAYNLKMCIRHHQEILKLFKKFKIFFNIEYSLQLMHMASSFTFLLFGIVGEADPIFFLHDMGTAWLIGSNLFLRCFLGEQFSEMHKKTQNALFYNLKWYDQSAKNKKLITIFHCGASLSLKLGGFGMFPASYYVFSYMLKSSYQYFNLLRAST